jgi:acyl dehydratase
MRIHVGQKASQRRVFVQADFDRFAALSGDNNPIHVDANMAAQTRFGRTVAHGMFLYSNVCALLGSRLPGPGTVQLQQDLIFPSGTPTEEEVDIRAEVTGVWPEMGVAKLDVLIVRPDGQAGLRGKTMVRICGEKGAPSLPVHPPSSPASEARRFKGMELGQRAEIRRAFTGADLSEYMGLSGDVNPILADRAYAQGLGLAGRPVPGALLGGLFSTLLGTQLPGYGTNYLKQSLRFPCPAILGQSLTATVEIIRFRPQKQLVNLRTVCIDQAGDVVCDGEALVLVGDVASKSGG